MNVLKPYVVEQIEILTRKGVSMRGIARELGLAKGTATRYQRSLGLNNLTCLCGKPINHKYWCKVRFARSPARQAFMERWHPKSTYELAGAFKRADDPTYFGE